MTRLDELTGPPIVGQTYSVPTVRYGWAGREFVWPVLTPLHTDPELGFDVPHWQVDGRFTTREMDAHAFAYVMANAPSDHYESSGKPIAYQAADCASTIALIEQPGLPMPTMATWRPMRCQRREIKRIWRCGETIARIEAHCGDNRAIRLNGRLLCPHKGADLTAIPVDADGFARCPMHQLRVRVAGDD